MLVVAALLFVSSRQGDISPELRVAILLVYTWAFIASGLIAHVSSRIREASAVFLAIGALITPLNFLLIYVELLDERDVEPDIVWLIGSVYSAIFYATLWQRDYGRLYSIPAGIAVINVWASLASVVELPVEWYGAWWIAFVTLASAIAVKMDRYQQNTAVLAGGLISLFFVGQSGWWSDYREPLPASLGLITSWLALTGVHLRAAWFLPSATTAAIAAATTALWAGELEADWYAYPSVVGGLVAVWSRRLWAEWSDPLARFGWLYAAAAGLSPLVLLPEFETGAHGAMSFAVGAAVFGSIAWRDVSRNALHLLVLETRAEPTTVVERTFFAWTGFGMLLVAVGYTQRELGFEHPDTGWSYLAIALVPIVLLGLTGRRWVTALAVLVPPALVAIVVSLQDAEAFPGHNAILLGIPAAGFFATFALTRRWPITLVASTLAIFAAAFAWRALEWEAWTLAITYSVAGAIAFTVLTPLRQYRLVDWSSLIVQVLSWSFLALGPAVAWFSYGEIADVSDPVFMHSAEFRTTFYLLLLIAPLIVYEGWRFKNWTVTAAGTGLASLAIAPLWPSYDWPTWTLALAYLGVGVVRFATMTPARTYRPEPQQLSIVVLSWAIVAAAPLTALIALQQQLTDRDVIAHHTTEYVVLMSTLLAFSPLILFEGWRFKSWTVTLLATAVAVGPVAGYWPAFEWEWWTLALAYLATGIAIFAATTRFRTYEGAGEQASVVALAWGVTLAAPTTAWFALQEQLLDPAVIAHHTTEYVVLMSTLLAFSPLILFEGWRFKSWTVTLLATAVAIGSVAGYWPAFEWEWWTLALAYLATGIAIFAATTRFRTYRRDREQASLVALTWGVVLAALVTAWFALQEQLLDPAVIAHHTTEYVVLMSTLLAFSPLILFEGWRFKSWTVTLLATAVAVGSVAGYWPAFEWEWWTLALAYLVSGVAIFAATTRFRTYRRDREQASLAALTWGVVLAALVTAWFALIEQLDLGAIAVKTVEYRTFAFAVFAFAPLCGFEAWRLHSRLFAALSSVATVTALLLTIAIWQPDSVQAYTLPVGIYLVLFGLVIRRSAELVKRHLMLHEAVLLVGVGYIVGPSIRDGLRPGGAEWGFVVLGEGATFILIGLLLGSRWLTVSGVLAMSGVAVRWLAVNTGETIPYWLTLGGVGLLLLVIGTAMLLGRDQWIRLRDSTTDWWRRMSGLTGLEVAIESMAAPAAVAVVGFAIFAGLADWETAAADSIPAGVDDTVTLSSTPQRLTPQPTSSAAAFPSPTPNPTTRSSVAPPARTSEPPPGFVVEPEWVNPGERCLKVQCAEYPCIYDRCLKLTEDRSWQVPDERMGSSERDWLGYPISVVAGSWNDYESISVDGVDHVRVVPTGCEALFAGPPELGAGAPDATVVAEGALIGLGGQALCDREPVPDGVWVYGYVRELGRSAELLGVTQVVDGQWELELPAGEGASVGFTFVGVAQRVGALPMTAVADLERTVHLAPENGTLPWVMRDEFVTSEELEEQLDRLFGVRVIAAAGEVLTLDADLFQRWRNMRADTRYRIGFRFSRVGDVAWIEMWDRPPGEIYSWSVDSLLHDVTVRALGPSEVEVSWRFSYTVNRWVFTLMEDGSLLAHESVSFPMDASRDFERNRWFEPGELRAEHQPTPYTAYGTGLAKGDVVWIFVGGEFCGESEADAEGVWGPVSLAYNAPCEPEEGERISFRLNGEATDAVETFSFGGAPADVVTGTVLRRASE